jgi:hypothetical protein
MRNLSWIIIPPDWFYSISLLLALLFPSFVSISVLIFKFFITQQCIPGSHHPAADAAQERLQYVTVTESVPILAVLISLLAVPILAVLILAVPILAVPILAVLMQRGGETIK